MLPKLENDPKPGAGAAAGATAAADAAGAPNDKVLVVAGA